MKFRPMRADEREAVLDLLETAFSTDERAIFERYMDCDPAYQPSDLLLALDDDRPVSCVQIFDKRIRLAGSEVHLGGIGSVGTHPDYRSRGLAGECLRRTEQRMRERGMALGLLFTGRFSFYKQHGWVRIDADGLLARVAPREASHGRPFRASDLPAVRALYDAFVCDGSTLRDEHYWQGQLRYARSVYTEHFSVSEREGRLVAYVRCLPTEKVVDVMEYAHAPGHAESCAELMLGHAEPEKALIIRLPPRPELPLALEKLVGKVDRFPWRGPMWRVLDRDALQTLAGHAGDDAALLKTLITDPPAHYWVSDRF